MCSGSSIAPLRQARLLAARAEGASSTATLAVYRPAQRMSQGMDAYSAAAGSPPDARRARIPHVLEHLPHFLERVDDDWRRPGPAPARAALLPLRRPARNDQGAADGHPRVGRLHEADLLIAGTGAMRDELAQLAASNPRIKFLGVLPQRLAGPSTIMRLSVHHPSLTYETFGMISLEAFARRTPVIAQDIGPLPEVVHESGGGLLLRRRRIARQPLGDYSRNPGLRDELGQPRLRTFLAKWTARSPPGRILRPDHKKGDGGSSARFRGWRGRERDSPLLGEVIV